LRISIFNPASVPAPVRNIICMNHGFRDFLSWLAYKEFPMSFMIFLIGFVIFIGGVAWALVTAGVPQLYVVITSVILLGVGIVTGVARTRSKDPS
jgi:poly(A) polymerase Pap1